jgi:small subunit ribosomal protein S4
MAKYNGPVCKLCRREGQKLYLKGERCYTDKCSIERRDYGPGQHGQKRAKLSEFGSQLREKQTVKRVYGMMERPFRNLFKRAAQEKGVTAAIFFRGLEMRLDNVVYRMGFARSRQEAKQIVRHNHILVNGKRLNIPSAAMRVGDEVSVAPASTTNGSFELAKAIYERRPSVPWFEVDHTKRVGKLVAEPTMDDVGLLVKERLIVELYSK